MLFPPHRGNRSARHGWGAVAQPNASAAVTAQMAIFVQRQDRRRSARPRNAMSSAVLVALLACAASMLVSITAEMAFAYEIVQAKGVDPLVDYKSLEKYGAWADRNYQLTNEDQRANGVPKPAEHISPAGGWLADQRPIPQGNEDGGRPLQGNRRSLMQLRSGAMSRRACVIVEALSTGVAHARIAMRRHLRCVCLGGNGASSNHHAKPRR